MNDILQDLTAPNLTAAIEENLFALFLALGAWPQAQVHAEAEVLWSITHIPFPLFNSILRARLAPERIYPVIESITAQATSRNVPLLWWTGASHPARRFRQLSGEVRFFSRQPGTGHGA
jgi:hypothetical protein